jgi:hypothetical protein
VVEGGAARGGAAGRGPRAAARSIPYRKPRRNRAFADADFRGFRGASPGVSAVQRIKATIDDAAHAALSAELRALASSPAAPEA